MFDTITATRSAMEELAASFEPCTRSQEQATRVVDELGVIRRLAEGMLAKAAKRVADTARDRKGAELDAARAYARAAGVEASEARRAIKMAKQIERLPATATAVQEGRLSTREAQMIADAATVDPTVEHERGNALPGERCEIPGVGPVNVEWVRELLGEAFVTAVVKQGRDITTVAHFGRHIPAHLRTALIVGGRECDTEGCHTRGYLELDHCDVDFARGGPAAWWNLKWKCSICHDRTTRGWIVGPRDPTTGKCTLSPPKSNDADSRAGP